MQTASCGRSAYIQYEWGDSLRMILKIAKNIEEIIGGTAIVLMLMTAVFNVFTRFILNNPQTWAEELECICLVYATFLCSAAAYKKNLHYGMDFLVDHLPLKAKLVLRRCITFICIFLFAYLTYLSFNFAMFATKTTAFFRLSYKYIDSAAVLAFISMTVYSVIYFIESFTEPEKYAARYVAAYTDELESEDE